MAVLSVQRAIPGTGLNPTYASAAGGGDSYPASGVELLHVKNGGGAPITLTVEGPNVDNFGTSGDNHDQAYTIPNGGERFIRVSNMARHRDANGSVQLTYSAVTSVTIAVLSV
jgi:hypothetical protein